MVEVLFSACLIGDENKLHQPFGREEGRRHVVGLTVRRYKAHLVRRDANEGSHVLVAPNGDRDPWSVVPAERTKTAKKGVSMLCDNESA